MKLKFLHLNSAIKPTPISEVVMEIRIVYTLQGINLTTRHPRVTKTPRVAIVHDYYQRVKLGPPYPSASLPRDTSTGIHGWHPHYPTVHLLGMVGCHTTQRPLKLLSLCDPQITYAPLHNQCLFIRAQSTWALIDTCGDYHLRSSEHENRPHTDLPIRYSPLSPNYPTRSQVVPTF
jgi:hypothetical protein